MGYKKMDQNLGFAPVRSFGPTGQADLALTSSMKHNRSLKNMEKWMKPLTGHGLNPFDESLHRSPR